MVKIVTKKPCSHRSLWRNCLNCRMGIYQTHCRIETGIRNSKNSHIAIVILYVFNEPVYRIPGICRFINILIGVFYRNFRTNIFECTFAHILSPDILKNHNIFILSVSFVELHKEIKTSGPSGFNIIRCTIKKNRMRDRVIFRCINRGKQFYSIAHGYINFLFIIFLFYSFCRLGIAIRRN